jgi:hypothetical protein
MNENFLLILLMFPLGFCYFAIFVLTIVQEFTEIT